MTFRVELSLEAEKEATAILAWLEEQDAGRAGMRWFLALDDAINSLERMPGRCPLAEENARFSFEVRELRYGRRPHIYRILFTVQEDTVEVLSIRHARRQRIQ